MQTARTTVCMLNASVLDVAPGLRSPRSGHPPKGSSALAQHLKGVPVSVTHLDSWGCRAEGGLSNTLATQFSVSNAVFPSNYKTDTLILRHIKNSIKMIYSTLQLSEF